MAQHLAQHREAGIERFRMTYEEFVAWAGEDIRAEWVNGEVIAYTPPDTAHQELVFFLATLLRLYTEMRGIGTVLIAPFEMRLRAVHTSREPDILFVAAHHARRLTRKRLEGPADVVIEVISDSTALIDKRDKFNEYCRAGVPEFWLIDPGEREQEFAAYHLTTSGVYERIPLDRAGCFHSEEIPGFWLDPAWLWRQPLPQPLRMLARMAPDLLREALAEEPEAEADGAGRR